MMPTGEWSYSNNVITDPNGNKITLDNMEGLSHSQKALYSKYIFELINQIPKLLHDLEWREDQVTALFKELRHCKNRDKEFYIKGMIAAGDIVSDTEANSSTSRDALNSVLDELEALIKKAEEYEIQTDEIPTRNSYPEVQ